MGEAITSVRALAQVAWEAQDEFLALCTAPLHREQELEIVDVDGAVEVGSRLAPGDDAWAVRTMVESAENWTWRPHGHVTELVVRTEVLGPDGTLVAVGRGMWLLGSTNWDAALAS